MFFIVPLATLKEESINVTAIWRSVFNIFMTDSVTNNIVKSNSVDWCLIPASKVLKSTSQEGLGEEETRDPEFNWSSIFNPRVKEIYPVITVIDPRS